MAIAVCFVLLRVFYVCHLHIFTGTYHLIPSCASNTRSTDSNDNRLWLVVRTLKDRSAALLQGDMVKLGRYKLKVKGVVLSADDMSVMDTVNI